MIYALDNPVKFRDPSGHNPLLIGYGAAVLAGGAVGVFVELGREILNGDTEISGTKVLQAGISGAVTTGLMLLSDGTGPVLMEMAYGGYAAAVGQSAGREATGQQSTFRDVVSDTLSGLAGYGLAKLFAGSFTPATGNPPAPASMTRAFNEVTTLMM